MPTTKQKKKLVTDKLKQHLIDYLEANNNMAPTKNCLDYDFVDHVCMFTNCYGGHGLYCSNEEKEALILFLNDCDVTYVPVGSLYIIE